MLCTELLGVNGVPSRHSIMCMILEGGVLAELQMVQELMNVDSACACIQSMNQLLT